MERVLSRQRLRLRMKCFALQHSFAAANRHAGAAKAQMQEIVAEVGAAQNRLDSLRE